MPKFLTISASITNSIQNSYTTVWGLSKRVFLLATLWPTEQGGWGLLAYVHPHPPRQCIMKKHLCSYSLHQPKGLAKQRETNLAQQRLKHTDPISNLSGQAVSQQQLCVPPHVHCHSSAKWSQVWHPEIDMLSSISSSSHFRCLELPSAVTYSSYC